ncbi:unnamed protein product [Candida parapsilosis]
MWELKEDTVTQVSDIRAMPASQIRPVLFGIHERRLVIPTLNLEADISFSVFPSVQFIKTKVMERQ